MKCPKCGYTSFESNDNCRKCSNDLTAFRQAHGLAPIVLPAAARATLAQSLGGTMTPEQPSQETGNDMFTFDLPQHEEPPAPPASADPFAFVTQPSEGGSPLGTSPAPPQDPFADLLESTPLKPKSAPEAAAPSSSGQGFELNSFNWDDTPEPAAAGESPKTETVKKTDDDFSSLFGDLGTTGQKP